MIQNPMNVYNYVMQDTLLILKHLCANNVQRNLMKDALIVQKQHAQNALSIIQTKFKINVFQIVQQDFILIMNQKYAKVVLQNLI